MPFWFVKLSVSPDFSVPAEIVTVAPVRAVSLDVTVTPESTATAEPPTVKVLVAPDGVTTGAAIATLTLSAAALLVSALSTATIESDRVVVFVLVVENVTDCKAVWYWADRSAAAQASARRRSSCRVMPF